MAAMCTYWQFTSQFLTSALQGAKYFSLDPTQIFSLY